MSKPNKKSDLFLRNELNKLKIDYDSARGKGLSVNQLKRETNFIEYVRLLKSFSKRYTVFIAAADTVCGRSFSPAVAEELMEIGLKINLTGMFRRSYAAIIDAGELVYESIAPSVTEPVEHECIIGDIPVKLESVVLMFQKKPLRRYDWRQTIRARQPRIELRRF